MDKDEKAPRYIAFNHVNGHFLLFNTQEEVEAFMQSLPPIPDDDEEVPPPERLN